MNKYFLSSAALTCALLLPSTGFSGAVETQATAAPVQEYGAEYLRCEQPVFSMPVALHADPNFRQGLVMVGLIFSPPFAQITKVTVEQSSGFPEFDQAVVDAYRTLKCNPKGNIDHDIFAIQRFRFVFDESVEEANKCSLALVDAAHDAGSLRQVSKQCALNSELHAQAVSKLNELPPKLFRKLTLQQVAGVAEADRLRYEIEVFFNFLEAYPPDIAFEKLDQLIGKLNEMSRIESISVVGSVDPVEARFVDYDTALKRAEFVKRYFAAAGATVAIDVSTRSATHQDTPEGRSRDRTAAVVVVGLRARAAAR